MNETTVSSDIQNLLQEGNAALVAGDSQEARLRFRRVLESDPQNVEALVGLAGAARPYREKREYLQRALELDPTSGEIRASLQFVENKLAAGEILAPRGVVDAGNTSPAVAPPEPAPPSSPAVETTYCYIHPNRETGLQCTNCQRYICAQCVRRAPVGQLCPECAKARRPVNYQVAPVTFAWVAPLSLIVGAVVGFLVLTFLAPIPFLSFILSFIAAPFVAEGYVRLLDRLTKAKRGKALQLTVGIGLGVGASFWAVLPLLFGLRLGFSFLTLLLFMGVMIATAMTRLR